MPNKKPFTQLAATFLVLALALVPLTPAFASNQSFIVGSLLTENNEPVSGTGINFYAKTSQLWTNTKTDKDGRFIAQLPKGEYSVSISGNSTGKSRCLNAGFNYVVSDDRQTLNIRTPKFQNYKIQYVEESNNSLVANVTTTLHNLYYKAVDNPALGDLKFFCSRQSITSASTAEWQAFEVDALETAKERRGFELRSNFMYRNGLGQMVTTGIAEVDWNSPRITFSLPDLPSVKINKKSLKIRNGKLTGTATFSEAAALSEFALQRKFNVTFRVIRGSKVYSWISKNTKFASISDNIVSFKLDTQFYKGARLEILLKGSNFSLGTNIVKLNVPK